MNASPLDRLKWAAAVAYDHELGAVAKALAPGLAWMANSATGDCRPSMATLGRLAGVTERAARSAVRELEAAGWLTCSRTSGRSCNTYGLNLSQSGGFDPFTIPTRNGHAGLSRNGDSGLEAQPGTETSPTRNGGVANPEQPFRRTGDEQEEQGGDSTPPLAVSTLRSDGGTKTTTANPRAAALRKRGVRVDHQDPEKQAVLRAQWQEAVRRLSADEISAVFDQSTEPIKYPDQFIRARAQWVKATGWTPRDNQAPTPGIQGPKWLAWANAGCQGPEPAVGE